MVLSQDPEMLQTGLLEGLKSRYSVQTKKQFASNENEPFWQRFMKPIQFQVLLDAAGCKNLQPEKQLARNENEPFWQWFGKPIQFQVLLDPDGCKNQIFGPDQKKARAQ